MDQLEQAGAKPNKKHENGIRVYQTEDLIVHWNANLCIHAGYCWKGLPQVFKPKERPWVTMSAATPEAIIKTVDTCPTDALKYELPAGSKVDPALAQGSGSIYYNRETGKWTSPAATNTTASANTTATTVAATPAANAASVGTASATAAQAAVQIKMLKGGPLMVEGQTQVFDQEGQLLKEGVRIVLCGCGQSSKSPFCDGSHIHKK